MQDLWRLSATDLAGLIKSKKVSAKEAATAALARLDAVNPKLNAVVDHRPAEVLAEAAVVDAKIGRGEDPGVLAGVPVTVKVNIDQNGFATTNGLKIQKDAIARDNSPVIDNLRKAGAIILGRTNCPAFSYRWFTTNLVHGDTKNPRDPGITPGGSSGGAGSAVAAGIGHIAHGTDIAGSIRYPAYANGVHGLRPTVGRIAAFNAALPERTIGPQISAVSGPLARTIADLRVSLAAMSGFDPRDPWWVPAPLAGPALPQPMRVAVVTAADDLAGSKLHPHVSAAIANAARWLADAGYEIVDQRTPGFTRAQELWFEMQLPEFREYMLPPIEKEGDQGIRTAVRFMLENLPSRDALPYMNALAERARLVREWTAFLDRVPLVLAPVSSVPVYEQGFDVESAARTAAVWRECATLMAIPVLGFPAAVVPTGIADGLPTAVQLIAPRFREDWCLDAAAAIEARAGVLTPVDPQW